MYVVLGANGRAGGETARALIARGKSVRVILRRKEQREKWAALGAEVVVADIGEAGEMTDALQGASGAFLLNPPPVSGDPYARTEEFGAALADAVRRAHLPEVVVLSSIGAQHATGTGIIATLNRFEALLDGVAPATAFLRSGYFVETWGEVAHAAMSEGVLPTFIEPSRKIAMVSTIDVGRAAATMLCEEWSGKRIVELSGPEDWSASDVALAFADVLDRQVASVLVAPELRAEVLAGEGVPVEVANALLGMYEGIANDLFVHQHDTERRRGTVSLTAAIERLVATLESASDWSMQSCSRLGGRGSSGL